MLEAYLFEATSLLEELDEILINCEKQDFFDDESINTIFRIMHTIKGSSAMMEFASITGVAHKMEDLFAYVRENGLGHEFNGELFELMFKSCDFLKSEIDSVQQSEPLCDDIGNFQVEINAFLKKISVPAVAAEEMPEATETKDSISDTSEEVLAPGEYAHAIRVFFDEDAQMENLRAFMLINSVVDICPDIKYYPGNIQAEGCAEEISQNGFTLYFRTEEDMHMCIKTVERFVYTKKFDFINEQPKDMASSADAIVSEHEQKAAAEYTQGKPAAVIAVQKSPNASTGANSNLPSTTSLINVNLTKLDKLMDLMGEIVITESMVTSIPTADGVDLDNFTKAARQLQKLTDELQENVMSIRMVPVSSVFQKMRRIVRDMSKKLDKDVELVLEGEDTEVDKTIVDSISDPIMHLVRNSMDHGIETRADRIKSGKSEKGTIILSAQNTGGEILVSVRDDGKGFDPKLIIAKAKSKGMLKKPEEEYSDKEIFAFLLMPGFSTKEKVTEFSGRGVGMDVVKKNIEKVGGDVSLDSEKGKGSVIIFKIPLTLAIVNGMEISVGDSVFTIPINNIRQSFKVEQSNILHDTDGNEIIMIRNQYYPLTRLHTLYDIETQTQELTNGIVILVESDEISFCIFADALLGEQQVVIKPLPIYLNKYRIKEHGIAGCAILGDGSISLILDIMNLYKNN